jgi:Fe2+ or Zn2+ uptake regulation protein
VRSPTELTEAFRAQGLKITPQRQLIFKILHGNQQHPSAESVYEAAVREMPAISLRTVYQTLNDLSAMGEIQTIDLGTGSARFDPYVEDHHHHLVCDRCGAVLDVQVDGTSSLAPVGELSGFAISSTELVFRGLCRDCRRADPSAASSVPPPPAINSRRPRHG